jgi:MFS superfamily sulfate permease-like transporter
MRAHPTQIATASSNQAHGLARFMPIPGLLIVRPKASDPPIGAALLDLEMTSELDVPSADALDDLREELDQRGIRLLLARVHPEVRETLGRDGVVARVGEDHIYRGSVGAVAAFRTARDGRVAPQQAAE